MRAGSKGAKTPMCGNVCRFATVLAGCAIAVYGAAPPPADVSGLVRRSLKAGERNSDRLRSWISDYRVEERQLDDKGGVKSAEVRTYSYVEVGGVLLLKLITKDGKALDGSETRKEDQRVARIAQARRSETSGERAKRSAEREKKKLKERKFGEEILEAFDFKVAGHETVAGRAAWVLVATPRAGYKPSDMRATIFPHLKGRIWIDEEDFLWAKAEADAFEPISVGFSIVAKLDEGAHLFFEQVRMNDGAWLLRKNGLRANARVAMVKRVAIDQATTRENFRSIPPGVLVDDTPPK